MRNWRHDILQRWVPTDVLYKSINICPLLLEIHHLMSLKMVFAFSRLHRTASHFSSWHLQIFTLSNWICSNTNVLLSLRVWHVSFDVKSICFSHTLVFKIKSTLLIDTAVVLCVTCIAGIRGLWTVMSYILNEKNFGDWDCFFSVFTYHCAVKDVVKIHLTGSVVPHVNSSRILWWLFMFLCPPQLEPLSSLNFPS